MAPNVKQVVPLTQQLENIDILQPKLLPLTQEEEREGHHSERKLPIQKETTATSDSSSYWDWPSQDDSLFPASSIETNIISQPETLRDKSNNVVVVDNSSQLENYWDENDVDYTERTLQKELHCESMTVKEEIENIEESHDYSHWNWDRISHSEQTKEEEKSRWIEIILEEERLQNMFSIQHVVELMEKSISKLPITSYQSVPTKYWSFSAEDNETHHHYWDWGNTPDKESYWAM